MVSIGHFSQVCISPLTLAIIGTTRVTESIINDVAYGVAPTTVDTKDTGKLLKKQHFYNQ